MTRRSKMLTTATDYALVSVVAVLSLLASSEAVRQHLESTRIHELAARVIADAHATDRTTKVTALRDYIRTHVTNKGAPYYDADRPFLRATALETMTSGLGFCGEDTRAFIVLAGAVGIPAGRINLYSRQYSHVVAVTDLGDGRPVIVDAMTPPFIPDLEGLDRAMLTHDYVDYSTLNLRRLHLTWLFSRIKLTIGFLTFWGDNPHALKALFWASAAAAILGLRAARSTLRYLLLRRGWVHRSSLDAGAWAAATAPLPPATRSHDV